MVLLAGLIWIFTFFSSQASTNTEWFTRVWQTDDGLLNNNISAIAQGRDGYLWIVTPVSLMRFDGIRFSPFPVKDFTGSIEPHNIRTLVCTSTGALLIVPNLGQMAGLNPDFSLFPLPNGKLPKGSPWALAETRDGSLWLGYASAIYRFKDGRLTKYTETDGVPGAGPPLLASDGAGNLWMAKDNRICVFRSERFEPIAPMRDVQCLAASHTNAVWFVAHGHLYSCDAEGAQDRGSFENSPTAIAEALLEDRKGAIWIGTDGQGLFRFSDSGFQRVETSHSCILSLAEDDEGDIWVGTGGGGLDRISLTSVRLEAMENNGILSQLQSVCQSADGRLWGATLDQMLACRINGKWTPVFTNAAFAGNVRCVATAPDEGIWIGMRGGQLLRLANTNVFDCTQGSDPAGGPIYALCPTPSGGLWILHRNVLRYLQGGLGHLVALPPHVPRISAIAADTTGNLWLGAKGMVLRFDGTNFTDESALLSISNHTVSCLYGASDGSLWIGCGGLGLLRFKDGRVGRIGVQQGLFCDYISEIQEDRKGWLWFGSDLGIFKIRQAKLEEAMANSRLRLHPIVYGRNEGLSSLEAIFSTASPFVIPRAIRTRDGKIWLLTHTGVVVADPDVLPENSAAPAVRLTQIAMDGQIIASYGGVVPTQTVADPEELNAPLRLPPGFHHLEFDFTAFQFSEPENIHFRYRLAGFDNGWIDADTGRAANYSRFAAGDYQFEVQASVGDGPWSDTPAALAFTVTPFFWQTWWFRLGAAVFLASLLATIVRLISYRQLRLKLRAVEQQAAIERERGRIARDIHDDLGNRLTKIELLTGLAHLDREAPGKAAGHIQQISTTARQATDALDEIVWAINPRNDTLPHLIGYIGQFTVEFLRTAGIGYHVDLPDFPPEEPVSAEVRHNLFLVVKESLNNIVCHAGATEVSMVIVIADHSFINVTVEDNGRGFNGEVLNGGGNGLKNMRQRMGEIGGFFEIKTTPGAGTRVLLKSPCQIKK